MAVAASERVLVASTERARGCELGASVPKSSALERPIGRAGWRITVVADEAGRRPSTPWPASGAAYLRTGGRTVAEWVRAGGPPGDRRHGVGVRRRCRTHWRRSQPGAADLVLRDWSGERLGELRDGLGAPAGRAHRVPVRLSRSTTPGRSSTRSVHGLAHQVDASGCRPAPLRVGTRQGRTAAPVPERRLSAAWTDGLWVSGEAPDQLDGAGSLRPILERSLAGTAHEGRGGGAVRARGDQVDAIAWAADALRRRGGRRRQLRRQPQHQLHEHVLLPLRVLRLLEGSALLNLRGDPYLMGIPRSCSGQRGGVGAGSDGGHAAGRHPSRVHRRLLRHGGRGDQGGLPDMHIHGFTPLEVWQGAETLGVTVREFLEAARRRARFAARHCGRDPRRRRQALISVPTRSGPPSGLR
jgi:hypothetical protein